MKSINEIASENDLQVITTTTALNGYPQALKKAIIGFEDFEQEKSWLKNIILTSRYSQSVTVGIYGAEITSIHMMRLSALQATMVRTINSLKQI